MTDRAILLEARARVAVTKPGVAYAILSDDPAINWDRGSLVRDEVERIKGELGDAT